MKKQYLLKVTASHWTAKNKLQEAVQKHFHSIDQTLIITERAKEEYLKDLDQKIHELNQEHKRCKPHQLYSVRYVEQSYNVPGVVSISFYEVKAIYK